MQVFRSGETLPTWCELEIFELVDLGIDGRTKLTRRARRERLMPIKGGCQVAIGDRSLVLREAQFLDVPDAVDEVTVTAIGRPTQLVRYCGHWGCEVGACGIFELRVDAPWHFEGDPVAYPKATTFDSHYHDFDEYWVILDGQGTVVVGERSRRVGPGDCIAIGMGLHHDISFIDDRIRSTYFETTLQGAKRIGHLWTHLHGPAQPQPGRA